MRRGVITLPWQLWDQDNIADREVLNLIKLSGDGFVISRRRSQIGKVANKLANEWGDSGEALEPVLSALNKVRTDIKLKENK